MKYRKSSWGVVSRSQPPGFQSKWPFDEITNYLNNQKAENQTETLSTIQNLFNPLKQISILINSNYFESRPMLDELIVLVKQQPRQSSNVVWFARLLQSLQNCALSGDD